MSRGQKIVTATPSATTALSRIEILNPGEKSGGVIFFAEQFSEPQFLRFYYQVRFYRRGIPLSSLNPETTRCHWRPRQPVCICWPRQHCPLAFANRIAPGVMARSEFAQNSLLCAPCWPALGRRAHHGVPALQKPKPKSI